ncbi:hypothetical protein NUW54_g8048 [Trametes sanguinea]|uniref:Uncharacterized protein n=1 Tax=Trametes sanguinea TaxID=158606 RepID=A0ACC1PG64_9APHY|nr:hypothetical protein NUW54_g8048 [Trametes sanguinea]
MRRVNVQNKYRATNTYLQTTHSPAILVSPQMQTNPHRSSPLPAAYQTASPSSASPPPRATPLHHLAFKHGCIHVVGTVSKMPVFSLHRRHCETLDSILKCGVQSRSKVHLRELVSALRALGFTIFNEKGSKFRFHPPPTIGRVALRLHLVRSAIAPHSERPDAFQHKHELDYYHQDALKHAMETLYGWGEGTFDCA